MNDNYWYLGHWRRVSVSMHWTVLISFIWLYLAFRDLLATIIGSIALFALFVAHEVGHALVLRKRGITVETMRFFGIHGKTTHPWISNRDEMFVAWGGVGAQLVVLLAAWAIWYALVRIDPPSMVWTVAAPTLFVWTKVNVLLMVIALLPIGPFDGRKAWQVIPWARSRWRKRRKRAPRPVEEKALSPERQRELEEVSTKAAADLLAKFGRSTDRKNEDA